MAVRGLPEAVELFGRIPSDTRKRLGALLNELGPQISAGQREAVPKKSGYLARGLGWEVLVDELRLRAGLLTMKGGRNSRYYGRFVAFGRRAQNVRVIRGTSASTKSASTRNRRAAGLALRKPYTLRVKAMAPRPFVNLPSIDVTVGRRLAQFWSEVLPS